MEAAYVGQQRVPAQGYGQKEKAAGKPAVSGLFFEKEAGNSPQLMFLSKPVAMKQKYLPLNRQVLQTTKQELLYPL